MPTPNLVEPSFNPSDFLTKPSNCYSLHLYHILDFRFNSTSHNRFITWYLYLLVWEVSNPWGTLP